MTALGEGSAVEPELFSFRGAGVTLVGDRWVPADPAGTVVLLHGGGQTRHAWDTTARGLARVGWCAITYDARGHGDSEWSAEGDYGLAAGVADLQALTATLDTVPVLVGASLGGMVSLIVAGTAPGLTQAVVLVDVVARIEPAGSERIRAFMTSRPDGFADLDEVADVVASYSAHRRRPRNLDGLRKNVRQRGDGRWYWHWDPAFLASRPEAQRDSISAEAATAAAALRVPALIVRGLHSDIVSDEGVRQMRELVPQAQYVEVRAGHMVAGDDNLVFTRELDRFLSAVAGRPGYR